MSKSEEKEIKEYLKGNFVWGSMDDYPEIEELLSGGAAAAFQSLLDDLPFVTISTSTGQVIVSVVWGPYEFSINQGDMEESEPGAKYWHGDASVKFNKDN